MLLVLSNSKTFKTDKNKILFKYFHCPNMNKRWSRDPQTEKSVRVVLAIRGSLQLSDLGGLLLVTKYKFWWHFYSLNPKKCFVANIFPTNFHHQHRCCPYPLIMSRSTVDWAALTGYIQLIYNLYTILQYLKF